jgi:hypothetical protein
LSARRVVPPRSIRGKTDDERPEIEEEASTNVNNGLPSIRNYDKILIRQGISSPFLLLQYSKGTAFKRGEKICSH